MNRQEAEAAGYVVDRHVYPWVAYKGPRFNPTEIHEVQTDDEAFLFEAVLAVAREATFTAHGCPEPQRIRRVVGSDVVANAQVVVAQVLEQPKFQAPK